MGQASLATKYRPRRFADVAGNRHVTAVLRDAARRHTPPQQILLSGESGLGKTTMARIFAAALFCERQTPDGDACGECPSCLDVIAGRHIDLIEFDAASNGGKDEVRAIGERAALAPMRAEWKLYVIDEAHGLSGPGTQAALKMIEEPPEHVVFILATTEPTKLGTALRGRCTWLEVLRPTEEEIAANLERIAYGENWALPDDWVDAVLAATDPALGLRGTVMTLEKLAGPLSEHAELSDDDLETLLGTVSPRRLNALTDAICRHDKATALAELDTLTSRTAGSGVRRQLLAWARREMIHACRRRDGVEEACHRFETLAEAGTHPGALFVAVARMAQPALADTPQALRALVEQAAALAEGSASAAATSASPASGRAASADVSAGPEASTEMAGAIEAPATTPAGIDETTQAAASPAGPLPATDPAVVALLNAVGRSHSRAAAVLRRCAVYRSGDSLSVTVPAQWAAKAEDVGLAAAVRAAGATLAP